MGGRYKKVKIKPQKKSFDNRDIKFESVWSRKAMKNKASSIKLKASISARRSLGKSLQ